MSSLDNGTPRTFYRIRDWNTRFENNRSREVHTLDWVKTPIQIGSEQWIELLDHPDGASHLGVWHAVIELAARCRPRGTLIRFNGEPHTAESIAKAAGLVPSMCRQAADRLTTIGWLEQISFTQQSVTDGTKVPSMPHTGAVEVPLTPQNGAASRRARGADISREISLPPIPPSRGSGAPRKRNNTPWISRRSKSGG